MSSRLRIVPLNENPRKRKKKPARARKTAKGLPPPARRRKRRARAGAVKIVRRRSNPPRRKPCFVIEAGHKGGTSFWDGRSFIRSKSKAKKFHHAGEALNTAKAIKAPPRYLWWRVVPA